MRPRCSIQFALYWRQDTRTLKPPSFLTFWWAPRPSSPERHYCAAFFALWLAFAKPNWCIYAKKVFQQLVCPSQALTQLSSCSHIGAVPCWHQPSEGWWTCFDFHTQLLFSELYVRFWFLLTTSQVLLEETALLDKVRGKPVSRHSTVHGTGDICRRIKPRDLFTLSYMKTSINDDGSQVSERIHFTENEKRV